METLPLLQRMWLRLRKETLQGQTRKWGAKDSHPEESGSSSSKNNWEAECFILESTGLYVYPALSLSLSPSLSLSLSLSRCFFLSSLHEEDSALKPLLLPTQCLIVLLFLSGFSLSGNSTHFLVLVFKRLPSLSHHPHALLGEQIACSFCACIRHCVSTLL